MHQLSKADARRIAVRAQLLDADRPTDLHTMLRHLMLLQADPTTAVAPSAHVVAWSRLGAGAYHRADLTDALEARTIVEHEARYRPAEDMALFGAEMAAWPTHDWEVPAAEWVSANDACRRAILDQLSEAGEQWTKQLPDNCVVDWKSSGWNNHRNRRRLLDMMVRRGEVAIAGRVGNDIVWDLAERVYPDQPVVPLAEAAGEQQRRRLISLGIARLRAPATPAEPNDVGPSGEEAVVEGTKGTWRVDPAQLGQPFLGRTAVLSPLDRLVFDRTRMVELFDFDYQLEMYKPAAQRRWGYWAMPILSGDRLVGKVDATADRSADALVINAIHEDEPFSARLRAELDAELADLARFLGLTLDRAR